LDFHDPREVGLYDARQETDLDAENRIIRSLGISAEGIVKRDFEGHVREEYSTYSWIMEAIIQKAGFAIRESGFLSPTIGTYLCEKVRE